MRKNGKFSRPSQIENDPAPDADVLMQERGGAIDRAMRKAVREALQRHKRLGQSVVVWRKGKIVELTPDQI